MDLFNVQNIIIYFILINVIGFLSMLIDKKKAERGSWRIKESTLLIIALIGGSIGSIIGMYMFRHKTQKPKFYVRFAGYFNITNINNNCSNLFFSSRTNAYIKRFT